MNVNAAIVLKIKDKSSMFATYGKTPNPTRQGIGRSMKTLALVRDDEVAARVVVESN